MEILKTVWIALTTENELLTKLVCFPLIFLEGFITMLLFITILKIDVTKKQKIFYTLSYGVIAFVCNFIIPKPYSNIITLIVMPFLIMYIFKINFFKGILAEFLPIICITILEIILSKIFFTIFNTSYQICSSIPLYRLIITLIIYFCLFSLYLIIKYFKFNINMLDSISKKNKTIIILNIISVIIVIFIQFYLIVFYNAFLPIFIIIINIISLCSYFSISIFSLIKTMKLESTTINLEQEKNYNKTLQILHDNVRAFKHDFSNIIAGIGGYVETKDMNGLEKYYKQLLEECNHVNNLSSLSPDAINNPGVYTVLANKYYKADELGIKITLDCFIDFNNLHMKIYEFTRILGILMDNAIEASSECEEKIINVTIRNDINYNRQLLIIENTYKNKEVNLDKIYEKGFSTKPKNTGLGLWEVNKIISKSKNLSRYTTKNDMFFTQQIEIYNE